MLDKAIHDSIDNGFFSFPHESDPNILMIVIAQEHAALVAASMERSPKRARTEDTVGGSPVAAQVGVAPSGVGASAKPEHSAMAAARAVSEAGGEHSATDVVKTSETQAKLRRFTRKRPPSEAEKRILELEAATNLLLPPGRAFTDAVVGGSRVSRRAYEEIRRKFVKQWIDAHPSVGEDDLPGEEASQSKSILLREKARKAFGQTNYMQRRAMLTELKEGAQASKDIKYAQELSQTIAILDSRHRVTAESMLVRGKVALLTYQDQRFVLPHLESSGGTRLSLANLLAKVEIDGKAQELWADFKAAMAKIVEEHHCDYGLCCELCVTTYVDQGIVRLHFHAGFGHSGCLGLQADEADFGECHPFLNPRQQELTAKSVKKKGYAGVLAQMLYYLSMPKIGQLWSEASKQPHKDYSVNPAWITAELEVGPCMPSYKCREVLRFLLHLEHSAQTSFT